MGTILNEETLKLARNYFGLSQKDFASKIGVSQPLISKIEKGLSPLTNEVIENLKSEFGENFFSQKMSSPNLKVHYRASATVAKKYTDLFEARLLIIANKIEQLLDYVDIPENKIPHIDLEDFDLNAEDLANEVRSYFELGNKPVNDFVKLLEKNGVIVYFFDYNFISEQNKNFDGVSFYVKGVPVILINDKIQNARKMLTLAHELGHLIMHNNSSFIISNTRDIEKEANQFASEFLAPKNILRSELVRLNFEKLFQLKAYWKVSASALLYKAKETTLTADQYRRWITQMAPYRKREPNDFDLEKPILLKKMFSVCEEEFINKEDFFNEFGMSKEVFGDVYSTLIEKERPKLRIAL